MKKIILSTFITTCFLGINALYAQKLPSVVKQFPKPDLGVKFGANFASLGGDGWEKTYQPGIVGGAFVGVHKHKIGVQAEVLVNTSHYTTTGLVDSVHKGDFRAIYLDIPILFEYRIVGAKLAPKVWLMAGPQLSNLISIKSLNNVSNSSATETFRTSTFSLVGGAEFRFLKFVAGARYILGLSDINNTTSKPTVSGSYNYSKDSWNNRSYQLYLGFKFI